MPMTNDPQLQKAIASILQRSEKQRDLQKLVGSFVDVGILPQLLNDNSQIIYGRRGTGKTHLLSVLVSELKKDPQKTVIYIDARTLGSTSQFSDRSVGIKQRCLALFRDVLGEVHNALLEQIVSYPTEHANQVLDELDKLATIITEPIATQVTTRVEDRTLNKTDSSGTAEVSASPTTLGAKLSYQSGESAERETRTVADLSHEEKIVFPALGTLLASILEKSKTVLFILLDEWSSIPSDIQPYLAEFLRRSFLPKANVVVKIASLEYRSNFAERTGPRGDIVGFEVGSDISTALDLDDYYVYDRNPAQVTDAFSDMLYRHVRGELPVDYLKNFYGITDQDKFVASLFTNVATFQELVRASEGVARDLINIFSQAFFATQRKGVEKIDKRAILEAARQWFEQDKAQNLGEDLTRVLERIVEEVIGHRKARSFMLPRELEKEDVIQKLFDARVVHLVLRGYADKDNPGVRYNIYTLDYGTYVDLLATSKAPDLGFQDKSPADDGEFLVPFDDKRSIRRIVLKREILKGQ
jgi:hypothetical protein